MTIEEMIDTLNASVLSNRLPNGLGLRMFRCDADKIIAALRAAAQIREETDPYTMHPKLEQAVKAWDAALGEKE